MILQAGTASKYFRGTVPWDTGVVGMNMYDDFGVSTSFPVFQYTQEFLDGCAAQSTKPGQRVRPGDVLLEVMVKSSLRCVTTLLQLFPR